MSNLIVHGSCGIASADGAFPETAAEGLASLIGHVLVKVFPSRADIQGMRVPMLKRRSHVEFADGHELIGTGVASTHVARVVSFALCVPHQTVMEGSPTFKSQGRSFTSVIVSVSTVMG